MDGWYYLHSNGELIFKRDLPGTQADLAESDLVRSFWSIDVRDRANAWTILVEALATGARRERVLELAAKWHCDDADAALFAQHLGLRLERDGDAWMAARGDFDNIQESPCGFGQTALDALAELAKALGFTGRTMWSATFAHLVTGH